MYENMWAMIDPAGKIMFVRDKKEGMSTILQQQLPVDVGPQLENLFESPEEHWDRKQKEGFHIEPAGVLTYPEGQSIEERIIQQLYGAHTDGRVAERMDSSPQEHSDQLDKRIKFLLGVDNAVG